MPRPRTPKLKAIVGGRALINPGRYRDRTEPKSPRLGEPPAHLSASAKKAWKAFRSELPWLKQSHRALVELASMVRAKVFDDPEPTVAHMNLMRLLLSQMGATPVDQSRLDLSADEQEDDPDKFFR